MGIHQPLFCLTDRRPVSCSGCFHSPFQRQVSSLWYSPPSTICTRFQSSDLSSCGLRVRYADVVDLSHSLWPFLPFVQLLGSLTRNKPSLTVPMLEHFSISGSLWHQLVHSVLALYCPKLTDLRPLILIILQVRNESRHNGFSVYNWGLDWGSSDDWR